MQHFKPNILAWRVFFKRLPTKVNLQKRGIILPSLLCSLVGSMKNMTITCLNIVGWLLGCWLRLADGGKWTAASFKTYRPSLIGAIFCSSKLANVHKEDIAPSKQVVSTNDAKKCLLKTNQYYYSVTFCCMAQPNRQSILSRDSFYFGRHNPVVREVDFISIVFIFACCNKIC